MKLPLSGWGLVRLCATFVISAQLTLCTINVGATPLSPSSIGSIGERGLYPGRSEDESPSLSETIEWIKSKLEGSRAHVNASDIEPNETNFKTWKYSNITLSGTTFSWRETYVEEGKVKSRDRRTPGVVVSSTDLTTTIDIQVDLSTLDPSSVRSVPGPASYVSEVFVVSFATHNSKKTVQRRMVAHQFSYHPPRPVQTPEAFVQVSGAAFRVQSEDLANRLAKALAHAIRLSGGKQEAF